MKEKAPLFHVALLQALAFVIPVWPLPLPVIIVLLALNWVFLPKKRPVFQNHWPLYLLLVLFAWYAVALIWTSHLGDGFAELETKLSLLLLPVILMTTETLSISVYHKILKAFVWGCVAACIICLGWATWQLIKEQIDMANGIPGDNFRYYYFFRDRLTPFFHPSYLSFYLCMALVFFWHLKNASKQKLTRWEFVHLFLILLIITLLSSKAGWIGLVIIATAFSIYLIRIKRMYKAVLLIGVGGVLVFASLYFTVDEFQRRIDGAWNALTAQEIDAASQESSTVRRLIWKAATIKAEEGGMLGYGTGSALDTLAAKYREYGLVEEANNRLNAHNQVLHSTITAGWIGGLLMSLVLLLPLIAAIRYRKLLLIGFLVLVLLNFAVEAMLERQAGVIFYAFIFALLFTQPWKTRNTKP